jgi:putative transposase
VTRTFLEQQARFDDFIDGFNNERPHQALNMQVPAQRYQPSKRPYQGLPDLDYPFHDRAVTVTTCGRICFNRQKINLSQVFRPNRRHQTNRRSDLARQLHGL